MVPKIRLFVIIEGLVFFSLAAMVASNTVDGNEQTGGTDVVSTTVMWFWTVLLLGCVVTRLCADDGVNEADVVSMTVR